MVGCGGEPATAPSVAPPRLAIAPVAPPAGPDDVVVARVGGQPVWASCVAAQARGRKVDVRTALADCVDLEVAAQEALRRGLDRDPQVLERTEQALVARFIDREFTARYQSPADLPPAFVEPIFRKNEWRLARDEYRTSFFVRVEVGEDEPAGGPVDREALAVIRAAHASLAGRKDLFPADVEAAVRAAAGPSGKILAAPFKGTTGDDVKPYYRDALFAIGAIGEVSAPVRGPWGWDLVLWTDVLPAGRWTREQVLADLWRPMRQRFFVAWAAEAGRGHEVVAMAAPEVIERLLGGERPAAPRPEGRR